MADKTFPVLTDGKRKWTPANAVENTNLVARGWKPVSAAPKSDDSKAEDAPKPGASKSGK